MDSSSFWGVSSVPDLDLDISDKALQQTDYEIIGFKRLLFQISMIIVAILIF